MRIMRAILTHAKNEAIRYLTKTKENTLTLKTYNDTPIVRQEVTKSWMNEDTFDIRAEQSAPSASERDFENALRPLKFDD